MSQNSGQEADIEPEILKIVNSKSNGNCGNGNGSTNRSGEKTKNGEIVTAPQIKKEQQQITILKKEPADVSGRSDVQSNSCSYTTRTESY